MMYIFKILLFYLEIWYLHLLKTISDSLDIFKNIWIVYTPQGF